MAILMETKQHATKKPVVPNEIKKYLKTNYNEDITTQNLWDAAKAMFRGKFTAIQAFLKKKKKGKISN